MEFFFPETDLIWPSWRKFSTLNLQSNEVVEYIRKIFSKKFENSPNDVPWIIHGIQGISSSYVCINEIGESSFDFCGFI